MKTISELRAAYDEANARVDAANDDREDAIWRLVAANDAYAEALDVWGKLRDQIKSAEGTASKPEGATLQ
jgi:hypothetical protein